MSLFCDFLRCGLAKCYLTIALCARPWCFCAHFVLDCITPTIFILHFIIARRSLDKWWMSVALIQTRCAKLYDSRDTLSSLHFLPLLKEAIHIYIVLIARKSLLHKTVIVLKASLIISHKNNSRIMCWDDS